MPIDKSPPWRAVSWETKYPEDKNDPPREHGLQYWMVMNDAGYTVCSDWMTEEQARMIAAAPEMMAALTVLLKDADDLENASEWDDHREIARAAIAKAEGK